MASKTNFDHSYNILGYNFSAPIFISPATRGAYGDPDRAEINFVDASASENILYVVSFEYEPLTSYKG